MYVDFTNGIAECKYLAASITYSRYRLPGNRRTLWGCSRTRTARSTRVFYYTSCQEMSGGNKEGGADHKKDSEKVRSKTQNVL